MQTRPHLFSGPLSELAEWPICPARRLRPALGITENTVININTRLSLWQQFVSPSVCLSIHPSIIPYLFPHPATHPSLSLIICHLSSIYYLSLLPVTHPPTYPSCIYQSISMIYLSSIHPLPHPSIFLPS